MQTAGPGQAIGPPCFVDGGLQQPFEAHMLQHLTSRDVASLACACRALRVWLQSQPHFWAQACKEGRLPPLHPGPPLRATTHEICHLLNAAAATKRNVINHHPTAVHILQGMQPRLSPNGKRIALICSLGTMDNGAVRVYDVKDGRMVSSASQMYGTIIDVAWSKDDQRVTCLSLEPAKPRDRLSCHVMGVRTGAVTKAAGGGVMCPGAGSRLLRAHPSLALLSPHGSFFSVLTPDGDMRVYHTATGEHTRALQSISAPPAIAWHPQEASLACSRPARSVQVGRVDLISPSSGECRSIDCRHGAVRHDNLGGDDGMLLLPDTWSPHGEFLACRGIGGGMSVWDMATGHLCCLSRTGSHISFCADVRFAIVHNSERFEVWELRPRVCVLRSPSSGAIECLMNLCPYTKATIFVHGGEIKVWHIQSALQMRFQALEPRLLKPYGTDLIPSAADCSAYGSWNVCADAVWVRLCTGVLLLSFAPHDPFDGCKGGKSALVNS